MSVFLNKDAIESLNHKVDFSYFWAPAELSGEGPVV